MVKSQKKSGQYMFSACGHFTAWLLALLYPSIFSNVAMAAVGGDSNAIEQVFCNIVIMFTGTTGKAVATVCVITVGVGALIGKVSWGMTFMVILGLALLFGAASIVVNLGGAGNSCGTGSILST